MTGVDRAANRFFLRYARPFNLLGGRRLTRATLDRFPQPGGGDRTGRGDLNAFVARLFDTDASAVSFGHGKVFKTDAATVNLFVEPQYPVAIRGRPEQAVFAGLDLRF